MMPKSSKGAKMRQEEAASRAVGAGKRVRMDTVDFSDPHRPKTCLEVDFPILPINQIAAIEGNAGKPIYQMSKWWARRRSSIFRSLLIAAATKAPDDPAQAAKAVWDVYYANHQAKGAFKNLKVADIFMGGGTTLVEGSRLGMQMFGVDLNPVAWFVVKQEFADVDMDEVQRLLDDIEAEVKPQVMPFYYCDGPNGEKGTWIHVPTRSVMGDDFDPLSLSPEDRKNYRYEGPEIIYTFWAKHGPCQVTGCGHRTPLITSPVLATKTLSVKFWEHTCTQCAETFDVEDKVARIAPDAPFFVAPTEKPYAVVGHGRGIICPHCGHSEQKILRHGNSKKVRLSLLLDPDWIAGFSSKDRYGNDLGGAAQDDAERTARWNCVRASHARVFEIRGDLPEEVNFPTEPISIRTGKDGGTIPKNSHYVCGGPTCGQVQDVLETVKASGKTGPVAAYAIQGLSTRLANSGSAYKGRFFAAYDERLARQYNAAIREWEARCTYDLADYWPKTEIPVGAEIGPHDVYGHHYSHWWTMFNPRQLLVLTQILKAIVTIGHYHSDVREYVLGAFQQYLRNQNMFCFWNRQRDELEPFGSTTTFHPKPTVVENSVFGQLGRGNWSSCTEGLKEARMWAENPWELVSNELPSVGSLLTGSSTKSTKVRITDARLQAEIVQSSATELSQLADESCDLVVTDPPFGHNVQYAEMSDFFYVWLRLVLDKRYPEVFGSELVPKALEVVTNRYRNPDDPDEFYKRLLTQSWSEAHRVLKAGGILAFTFHHSEDAPWVAVLESLFDAGFYLEATFPIRSDETKGNGDFGSQKIEFDIVHVCRKRAEDPTPVSWARMRREVLADVRQLQSMLENHAKNGLPAADLQVIRRGKALEYYSRHYGKVYVDEGRTMSVKEAIVGINQLIDEDFAETMSLLPANAEPITRQFLRIFENNTEIPRDQMQKFLRGSGIAPDEFVNRGWCVEKNKTFFLVDPLDYAKAWHGRFRRNLASDFDQSWFLVGACFDGSGINALETLKNENFTPHPALRAILEWYSQLGYSQLVRMAARRAMSIYDGWASSNHKHVEQLNLFFNEV